MRRIETTFSNFFRREATGGILLIIFTLLAILFANIPAFSFINNLWTKDIHLTFGSSSFHFTLQHVINDGLMAVFFFVVGLEIKREMRHGELSSIRKACFPIVAAIGGMVLPAIIYKLVNINVEGEAARGWGIPMATDIAFAVGVVSMLGKRVPLSLKIFLMTLSIVDDLGAIIVIALFYPSHDLHLNMLFYAAIIFGILMFMNYIRVKSSILFIIGGIVLWFFIFNSGIHATIAGVLLALAIPAESRINEMRFFIQSKHLLGKFKEAYSKDFNFTMNKEEQEVIEQLSRNIESVRPMTLKLEHSFHTFVMFIIMPLFALANAGVCFQSISHEQLTSTVSIGIFLGLVVGKPLGILSLSYLAVKLKIASIPENIKWKHIFSIGCLAGIGFTMSLFINGLAFSSETMVNSGKVSILIGSLVIGVIGWFMCKKTLKN